MLLPLRNSFVVRGILASLLVHKNVYYNLRSSLPPERRDAPARSYRPARLARNKTNRIVIAGVELLPVASAIGRNIRAGGARRDPHLAVRQVGHRRTKALGGRAIRLGPPRAADGDDGDRSEERRRRKECRSR